MGASTADAEVTGSAEKAWCARVIKKTELAMTGSDFIFRVLQPDLHLLYCLLILNQLGGRAKRNSDLGVSAGATGQYHQSGGKPEFIPVTIVASLFQSTQVTQAR